LNISAVFGAAARAAPGEVFARALLFLAAFFAAADFDDDFAAMAALLSGVD
jgi:hypothetical protein